MEQKSLTRLYVRAFLGLLGVYFDWYHHLKVEGAENIPHRGPLLMVINHVSLLEPFAGGVAVARNGVLPGVDLWTVSKKELFTFPPVAWVLRSIGMFPLDREHGDVAAMRTLMSVLKRGGMIGVAPEGTRSPTGRLQALQPALAKIVVSRRVPILPVGAVGAEKALPMGQVLPRPRPITIRFGPVFELSEFYDVRMTDEVADRAAWVMRQHMAELLPDWMRELPPPSNRLGARVA